LGFWLQALGQVTTLLQIRRHVSITTLVVFLFMSPGAQTAQISTEASSHLTEIVSVLQKEWLYRGTMDWSTFRQRVLEKAGAAQTIPETYDAIRLALTLLGDKHTYYVTAAGENIYNPQSPTQSTGECTPAALVTPPIQADVGYVRIQITPATPKAAIQDALLKGDGAGTIGWIVDLRNSRGGNTWPALVGGIEQVESPYKFAVSNPRVAVLTDIGVASSGEAMRSPFVPGRTPGVLAHRHVVSQRPSPSFRRVVAGKSQS
jgi:hypothetical protein